MGLHLISSFAPDRHFRDSMKGSLTTPLTIEVIDFSDGARPYSVISVQKVYAWDGKCSRYCDEWIANIFTFQR